jgi:hypothetical protein
MWLVGEMGDNDEVEVEGDVDATVRGSGEDDVVECSMSHRLGNNSSNILADSVDGCSSSKCENVVEVVVVVVEEDMRWKMM